MAGTKVAMPANGSTDWSDFVIITQHSYRHMSFVSFTNTTSTGAPAIEAGSYAVVNGTMYSLTPSTGGNETISTTGLSTGFTSGELWVKAVPSTGTSITAEYTTTAPTWSAAKGGYYSTGNDKYLGGVYKSTGAYGEKWSYKEGIKFYGGRSRPILEKDIEIGTWNMDTVNGVNVAHGLVDYKRIRGIHAIIRNDDGTILNPLYAYRDTSSGLCGGVLLYNSTNILLQRQNGTTIFDNADHNSTTISRGDIILLHKG